jgi:hypothetical protein
MLPVLATVQGFGNLAASTIAGALWTALSGQATFLYLAASPHRSWRSRRRQNSSCRFKSISVAQLTYPQDDRGADTDKPTMKGVMPCRISPSFERAFAMSKRL